MGNHNQPALVVNRLDGVEDGHRPLDRFLEEPTDDVRHGRPPGGDLLARNHRDAGRFAALHNFSRVGHRVVVGDRDQVDTHRDGCVHQLGRCDHSVGSEGVAVRISDRHLTKFE